LGLVHAAFGLELLVAGQLAGAFLEFAAHLLAGAFDAILVGHGCSPVWTPPERRRFGRSNRRRPLRFRQPRRSQAATAQAWASWRSRARANSGASQTSSWSASTLAAGSSDRMRAVQKPARLLTGEPSDLRKYWAASPRRILGATVRPVSSTNSRTSASASVSVPSMAPPGRSK